MTISLIPMHGWHGTTWSGPGFGAYGWPWPGLIWLGMVLLFWAGLIALLVWAVRASTAPRHGPDTAMEVLRRRLASGEISREEYEHIRGILQD